MLWDILKCRTTLRNMSPNEIFSFKERMVTGHHKNISLSNAGKANRPWPANSTCHIEFASTL